MTPQNNSKEQLPLGLVPKEGNYKVTVKTLLELPMVVEEVDKHMKDGSGNGLLSKVYSLCNIIDQGKIFMDGTYEFEVKDRDSLLKFANCYPLATTRKEGDKILFGLDEEDVNAVFKFLYRFVEDYSQNPKEEEETK